MKSRNLVLTVLSLLCGFIPLFASAEEMPIIKIGMSAPLSGPLYGMGSQVKAGIEAYFNVVNKKGGIHNRKLELDVLDDQYDPKITFKNVETLLNVNKVFQLFSIVGTAPSLSILPLVDQYNTVFFMPFTGAEALKEPFRKNVYTFGPSYFDEANAIVGHVVDDLHFSKICILVQDDQFGIEGEAAVRSALKLKNLELECKGVYKRNTARITEALDVFTKSKPEAVILLSTTKPVIELIKMAKFQKFSTQFLSLSPVSIPNLIRELADVPYNLLISQPTPYYPADTQDPLVIEYRAAMKASDFNSFDAFSFGSFMGSKMLVSALEKVGPDLTLDKMRDVLDHFSEKVGPQDVHYTPTNHRGSKDVYFLSVKNGKVENVTDFK